MNIVLIGYRGTGKSTVGKLVAERLGYEVVSTDAEIVKREGATIPEIVQRYGWEPFRDRESEVCRDLGAKDRLVIDTGGGAILREENVRVLKGNGVLVWLTAEVKTIARRIGGDDQRPSLTGTKSFVDEIEEVLQQRLPKYQTAADQVICTDELGPVEIADRVIAAVQSASGRAPIL
jgi:shikimate kinase